MCQDLYFILIDLFLKTQVHQSFDSQAELV